MRGLLMYFLERLLALPTPFLANHIWSRWQCFESLQVCEKMVRIWVQHHTVFERSHKSTLIHWQTWDFQHSNSDQSTLLFPCSHLLMAVRLWREDLKGPPLSLVTYNTLSSLINQKELISFCIPNHERSWLSTLHACEARPRDNSPLTTWYQTVSAVPADKSLSENDCVTRTSGLFPEAGNSNCLKSSA